MLETTTILAYRAHPKYTATQYTLFDLNDHADYGSFYKNGGSASPTECVVKGKTCTSEVEWDALISPFMGDAP